MDALDALFVLYGLVAIALFLPPGWLARLGWPQKKP